MSFSTIGLLVIATLIALRLALLFFGKRYGNKFLPLSILESLLKSLGKMV